MSTREIIRDILIVLGTALVSYAGWLVAPALGLAVIGGMLLTAGILAARPRRPKR